MERNECEELRSALRKLRHLGKLDPKIAGFVRDAEHAAERVFDAYMLADTERSELEAQLRGLRLWPLPADPGMALYPTPEALGFDSEGERA